MHRPLLVMACCILAATNSAQALTVGKTTVDPNLSGAGIQSELDKGFWTADQRLAKNVTVEARRKTVYQIFSEITSQTGVQISVGYNSNDWQVRDRKMVIFAKDMPLRDLMQSVGRVMKFKWERIKKGDVYSYRLYMDRQAVIDAEMESARAEERYNKAQYAKRAKLADGLDKLSSLSQEDLDKLRKENPAAYCLAVSGLAGSLERLFDAMPAARNAFVNGNELALSKDQTSEEIQTAMTGLAQAIVRMNPDTSGTQPTPEQLVNSPQRLREVRLYLRDPGDSDDVFSRYLLGQVAVKYTNSEEANASITELAFPIMDPDSSMGKGMGQMLASVLDSGPTESASLGISIKIDPKELEQIGSGEPVVDHTASAEHPKELDSTLEIDFSKVKPSANATEQYADQLAALAEATKWNVVSDSFPASMTYGLTDKVPAASFLSMTQSMRGYNWWKRGSTVEFRDRLWFRKRSRQIPEAWLEKWRTEMETAETVDIDSLADMAVYVGDTDSYAANIVGDSILDKNEIKWAIQQAKPFLRLYAILSAKQRKMLLTEKGLDIALLTSAQKDAARECFSWWDGKRHTAIVVARTQNGKRFSYTFKDAAKSMNVGCLTTPYCQKREAAK